MSQAKTEQEKRKEWHDNFEMLKTFKEQYGDLDVPYEDEYKPLCDWMSRQRMDFNSRKISADHFDQLDELGLEWRADENDWMRQYRTLLRFKKKYGHCKVRGKRKGFVQLEEWVYEQRELRNTNEPFAVDRYQRLEDAGLNWGIRTISWNDRFDELKRYKRLRGHCNVPTNYPKNKGLARWVRKQREEKQNGNRRMTSWKIKKLESIGFEWSVPNTPWEERFEQLKEYKAEFGHCNVPRVPEHKELALWVSKQRYRKVNLSEERVQMLEDLGFTWSMRKRKAAPIAKK